MTAYKEYLYRRMFGLSKREMQEEPIEDITINFKLQELVSKKMEMERAIVEGKSRRSST